VFVVCVCACVCCVCACVCGCVCACVCVAVIGCKSLSFLRSFEVLLLQKREEPHQSGIILSTYPSVSTHISLAFGAILFTPSHSPPPSNAPYPGSSAPASPSPDYLLLGYKVTALGHRSRRHHGGQHILRRR